MPPLFEDDNAITMIDDDSDPVEQRFVSIGIGAMDGLLVAIYCYRGKNIRILSARPAEGREREQYEARR